MKNISSAAKLSRTYTNHCVRATTSTLLGHKGVTPRLIKNITGHKKDESLQHYITTVTEKERMGVNKILDNACEGINHEEQEQLQQTSTSDIVPHSQQPPRVTMPELAGLVPSQQVAASSFAAAALSNMFAGATFTGSVNLNLTLNFNK